MRSELDAGWKQALLLETGRRDAELAIWNRLLMGLDSLVSRNAQPVCHGLRGDSTIRGCPKEKPAGCEEKQRCKPGQAHDLFNPGYRERST